MWARPIPSYIVDILSTFVSPSVCLFVEKLTPMGSDFDKHGEEAHTHPLVENLDDAVEYISVWGMSKEGSLPPPTQFEATVMSPLESVRTTMGWSWVRESSRARHAAVNSALPDEPPPVPPPTRQHPPSVVSCL